MIGRNKDEGEKLMAKAREVESEKLAKQKDKIIIFLFKLFCLIRIKSMQNRVFSVET